MRGPGPERVGGKCRATQPGLWGRWRWEKAVPLQVSKPLFVPSSQEVCLECWRDQSQRECPLPRPWGEEGPPLGGECGFRISFQPHQSRLRYPYPAILPSMPHAFSNPAADPDQSAQRVVGGLLVQWLKNGQTWIPAPAWLLSSYVALGWSFFFPEPRFPVNWEILRGEGSGR